jgi:hypothetical protein
MLVHGGVLYLDGTAVAVAPGHAVVGHSSEPDDVVVFTLGGDGPRLAHEGSAPAGLI